MGNTASRYLMYRSVVETVFRIQVDGCSGASGQPRIAGGRHWHAVWIIIIIIQASAAEASWHQFSVDTRVFWSNWWQWKHLWNNWHLASTPIIIRIYSVHMCVCKVCLHSILCTQWGKVLYHMPLDMRCRTSQECVVCLLVSVLARFRWRVSFDCANFRLLICLYVRLMWYCYDETFALLGLCDAKIH